MNKLKATIGIRYNGEALTGVYILQHHGYVGQGGIAGSIGCAAVTIKPKKARQCSHRNHSFTFILLLAYVKESKREL